MTSSFGRIECVEGLLCGVRIVVETGRRTPVAGRRWDAGGQVAALVVSENLLLGSRESPRGAIGWVAEHVIVVYKYNECGSK
jgi:hypothetical protein